MFLLYSILGLYTLGVLVSLLWNFHLKGKGLEGISTSECFNPIKMFSVLMGFLMSVILRPHILEQIVLRVYDDDCRVNCLNSKDGKCTSCGCHAYAKMMSPLEKDSRDNWGTIIWSKKRYYKHRETFPVTIKVEYNAKNT